MDQSTVEKRRAIEALRAGVPNRDVVRLLPPVQPDMERRFRELLTATEESWTTGMQSRGILLEGDFGAGKSHWLEFFQHIALEQGYVCSSLVMNKETPLHDALKIFRACVEAAVAPGKESGPALEEVALTYNPWRAPTHEELRRWTETQADVDPRLAATFWILEHQADPAVLRRVLDEWTGYPMKVPELRQALQDSGAPRGLKVGRPRRMPISRRFEFLTRFFRAAGYKGWVVLLDEAEMISKYSLRQRARAYAHLAQLLGSGDGSGTPGLATVFTITRDYTGQVLDGGRNDWENIPAKLPRTGDAAFLPLAETGMQLIRQGGTTLSPPSREQVDTVYREVRALYSQAYGWEAPELTNRIEYSSSTPMRQHIRSWGNAWDLRRLYDQDAALVVEELQISYEEDADFQAEAPENEESEGEEPTDGGQ